MDLSIKTNEICEELSTGERPLIARIIMAKNFFPKLETDIYLGRGTKRFLWIFKEPPIFTLEQKSAGVILTSFSREYDEKIKEIAKKNSFGYNLEEPKGFTFYF